MDWTKEKAERYLDKIVDDGESKEAPKNFEVEPAEIKNEEEQKAYYGLCSLLEAIVREFARMTHDDNREDFIDMLKKSEFDLVKKLGTCEALGSSLENFDPDSITTADARMQNLLRLGNELIVATEISAAFHQTILQYPTHGFAECTSKIGFDKTELALNFCIKMAYAEILRLISVVAETGGPSLMEILSRWDKTVLESEYLERAYLNYINNSELIIELPSVVEVNAARATIRGLRYPIEMPLLANAVNAYDRITSVFPPRDFDEKDIANTFDFIWYCGA